jgi:hypothetical protein
MHVKPLNDQKISLTHFTGIFEAAFTVEPQAHLQDGKPPMILNSASGQ